MKHYDDRINDMCEFKKKLLLRRLGGSLNRNLDNIGDEHNEREVKRRQILTKKMSMNPKEMQEIRDLNNSNVHQASS